MDAYEAKLEAARTIIEQLNQKTEKKIEFDKFVTELKNIGGVTDEALNLISWEDLMKHASLPLLTAKQVSDCFRKKEPKAPKALSEKKVQVLPAKDLLANYSPLENNPVTERLLALSRGLPCIVFSDSGSVNVDASHQCLDDIIMGHEPRTIYVGVDGIPQKVFKVGDRPDTCVKENPLIPGSALRGSDEQCSRTFRSWAKVPHKVRVLLRLALDTRELVIDQVGRIHDTLDLLLNKTELDAVQTVSQRFPRAALAYREKETAGSLPALKLTRNSSNSPKQDPFFGHRTY